MNVIELLAECRAMITAAISVFKALNMDGVVLNMDSVVSDCANVVANIDSIPTTIGQISDGYHTFDDLYEHRIELWIQLCKGMRTSEYSLPWRTKLHSDGTEWAGWFLLGAGSEPGCQITYHLPISRWDDCSFAETIYQAPPFDGHTSADVLERLRNL